MIARRHGIRFLAGVAQTADCMRAAGGPVSLGNSSISQLHSRGAGGGMELETASSIL